MSLSSPEPLTTSSSSVSSTTGTFSGFVTRTSSPPDQPTLTVEATYPYPPMTTPWSAPETCTWTYDIDPVTQPGAYSPIAWLDREPIENATTHSCYPDGMFDGGRTGTFSPGTCPNGWTTVSVEKNTNEAAEAATTTVVCCSSEYSLQGDHCERQVPTVLAVPISYNHTGTNYNIMTDSTTTLISATLALYPIKALFQEEDIIVLGITDESDIDDEPASSQGMSLSTRIGIGVGSAVGGLLLIGLIVWLVLRKRHSKRAKTKTRNTISPGEYSNNADGCAPFDAVTAMRRYVHRHQGPEVGGPVPYQVPVGADGVVAEEGDIVIERDGEIKVLKAQKAAIERRIEELEKSEPDDERETPLGR